jgi:hypothetical protein
VLPSTLAGLLLLIASLLPGFVFLERRESRHAGRSFSVLRETSVVVITSVVTIAVAIAVFGVVRWLLPDATPDTGRWIREGSAYATSHYLSLSVWCASVLALASLLSWWAAIPPTFATRAASMLPRVGPDVSAWLLQRRGTGRVSQASGWTLALNAVPNTTQWLTIYLVDGGALRGTRASHNTQIDETTDRDLVLGPPLSAKRDGEWAALHGEGTLVVSAARISFLTIRYSRDGRMTHPRAKLLREGTSLTPAPSLHRLHTPPHWVESVRVLTERVHTSAFGRGSGL